MIRDSWLESHIKAWHQATNAQNMIHQTQSLEGLHVCHRDYHSTKLTGFHNTKLGDSELWTPVDLGIFMFGRCPDPQDHHLYPGQLLSLQMGSKQQHDPGVQLQLQLRSNFPDRIYRSNIQAQTSPSLKSQVVSQC